MSTKATGWAPPAWLMTLPAFRTVGVAALDPRLLKGYAAAAAIFLAAFSLRLAIVVAPLAGQGRFAVEADAIPMDMSATVALSLIFHELAINAVKHGTWSGGSGRVDVTIRGVADREGDTARGLGGAVTLDYARHGLTAVLTFPLLPHGEDPVSAVH